MLARRGGLVLRRVGSLRQGDKGLGHILHVEVNMVNLLGLHLGTNLDGYLVALGDGNGGGLDVD